MKIRNEIMEFAESMEKVLSEHDHDRGDSWKESYFEFLQGRMLDEVEESKQGDAKLKEWIDVAIFCMMIHWISTHKRSEEVLKQ